MSSQESKISNFLNGKPSIEPVGPSSILSRLRTFLPQLEEANRNMPENASADAFQIEDVKEESSDDSSDDDSDSEVNSEDVDSKSDLKSTPSSGLQRIEIDLDVFKEENSAVDGRDVSIHEVDSLPAAFQSKSEESPKKPLIEEL